ncbi:unnamed protein product [Sympodiomycopsis kandeliae]
MSGARVCTVHEFSSDCMTVDCHISTTQTLTPRTNRLNSPKEIRNCIPTSDCVSSHLTLDRIRHHPRDTKGLTGT